MTITISENTKKISVNNPEILAKVLRNVLRMENKHDQNKEHFWGIYLSSRNIINGIELISLGTLNASLVHPRETFAPALVNHSVSIIIAHNHPSGANDPSEDDIALTRRLEECGKILGIDLLDHLIITLNNGFYSFKENHLI